MVERDNITLAWRIVLSGTRASLLHRASAGPPTRLPDKRDLSDLEEDFRELGVPLKCLPSDENIHLSTVSPGTIELIWSDRPARSALYTDLKTFFHKARPDKVTKRLIGAVMMYCLPPSTTNLQHIAMDYPPIAMFADPEFNPDLWDLRREVLKHQKKSFNSPPLPSQTFQPGTLDYALSTEQTIRRIKRESPSDTDAGLHGSLLSGVTASQHRRHTPLKQHSDPFFRPVQSSPGQPMTPGTSMNLDRGYEQAHVAFHDQDSSAPGGLVNSGETAQATDLSGGFNSEHPMAASETRGSHTVIPRKRALSDASASQDQRRPSHAFALDQDRDGDYMRRDSYSSDALRDSSDRRNVSERGNARAYDRRGGRDRDDRDYAYDRTRNGFESHRRRGSDVLAPTANGSSSRQEALDSSDTPNGRHTPPRLTDTLDRILASPSFARMELDASFSATPDAPQEETAAPGPKLSNLDIMALKAKIPRIEAERDAARLRARKLEDDLAAARHGSGRERGLEAEIVSWRARAEDAVYRSDALATRLKRLLAGEIPESLNPDADEAITLLGHVLNRMRRDIAQAEAERARYDSLSRNLENLVAHRDTIPPLIEALQQIANATRNIKLPN